MHINLIGLGYIGLPTALMFAASQLQVTGTDIREDRLTLLGQGKLPFSEPGLDALFDRARENLSFTAAPVSADAYILAVQTPCQADTGLMDASFLETAVEGVLSAAPKGALLIIESTVSPNTLHSRIYPLVNKHMRIAYVPERILPGNMLHELVHNSRVIGADSPAIGREVQALYRHFCVGDMVLTDILTAEVVKLAENTYRDVNIAYANTLAQIARKGGVNVYEVIRLANMHPRVQILAPGPGVGGHCLAVDPYFLAQWHPMCSRLIYCARTVNESMPQYVLERIRSLLQEEGLGAGATIGLYGLTYKENTPDLRNSPGLALLDLLTAAQMGPVILYDPVLSQPLAENQALDFQAFLEQADLVVLLVGHEHLLRSMDRLRNSLILDTRGICPLPGVHRL